MQDNNQINIKKQEILTGLKKEINETLLFFVKMDLEVYGHITESTREIFKTQQVKFPKELKPLLNR